MIQRGGQCFSMFFWVFIRKIFTVNNVINLLLKGGHLWSFVFQEEAGEGAKGARGRSPRHATGQSRQIESEGRNRWSSYGGTDKSVRHVCTLTKL